MTALYTDAQRYNIHLKLHPDCCTDTICKACGASAACGTCKGDLTGLVLELFQEAACYDRNANFISLGYAPHNRNQMRETARVCDAAARELFQ